MKRTQLTSIIILVSLFVVLLSTNTFAAPSKIAIGHPACLSAKYAKAGEQDFNDAKACSDWVNSVYGGVAPAGNKVPIAYKYYDCNSKKEEASLDAANYVYIMQGGQIKAQGTAEEIKGSSEIREAYLGI